MKPRLRDALWLAALGCIVLAGCQARREGDARSAAAGPAPTLDELRNATYAGLEGPEDTLTLRDGRWEGDPYDAGSSVRPSVSYAHDLRLAGDLDGDGAEEAVAFLAYSGGGSGDFLNFAVMARRPGGLRQVAVATVGDRVQVRGARIENRAIALDLVQAGRADAACCPGEMVTRVWELESGTLVEREMALKGRLSPEAIGANEWQLEAWDLGETAPPEPRVTISYRDGRLIGVSGCNRYTAAVTPGEAPGDITVGPAIGTRMACPPPAMEAERRFLEALEATRKIGFVAGRLALTVRAPQGVSTMLFTPSSAATAAVDTAGGR